MRTEFTNSKGWDPNMTRAFREGVDRSRRVQQPARRRTWKPFRDLQGLSNRTVTIGNAMGPLSDIPAMVTIENEHWIFQRIEEGVLYNLTHRLIIHEEGEPKTIGATSGMETAMQVAQAMASKEGKIVLIKPL
mgnify:CR=1 FL=1